LEFSFNDSFQGAIPESDLRFEIDKLFREHNISIPFPQRDVHIIQKPQ
jgi:small-conductance mechanosensitive channel